LPVRAHALEKLTHFLEYPELELSTNLAENSMRPVALGRKNWIHIGSPLAGPKVAAILSIVESCRRMRISVRDYLAAVLPGLADPPDPVPPRPYSRCVVGTVWIRRA
jgi:transposase